MSLFERFQIFGDPNNQNFFKNVNRHVFGDILCVTNHQLSTPATKQTLLQNGNLIKGSAGENITTL